MRNNNDIHTSAPNKKGDYWYIDRKAGTRMLLLTLALGLTMLGAACCANNDQAFQPQTQAAVVADSGSNSRGASGLLGSTLGLVNTVVSSAKWFIDGGHLPEFLGHLPFGVVNDGRNLNVSSAYQLDKVEIYYSDRSKDSFDARSGAPLFKLRPNRALDGYMVRLRSDGSKWYFDNASNKWFTDADSARWYGDVDAAVAPTVSAY